VVQLLGAGQSHWDYTAPRGRVMEGGGS